jgi:hypothetical protein
MALKANKAANEAGVVNKPGKADVAKVDGTNETNVADEAD